jgi:hypothetical protein
MALVSGEDITAAYSAYKRVKEMTVQGYEQLLSITIVIIEVWLSISHHYPYSFNKGFYLPRFRIRPSDLLPTSNVICPVLSFFLPCSLYCSIISQR